MILGLAPNNKQNQLLHLYPQTRYRRRLIAHIRC